MTGPVRVDDCAGSLVAADARLDGAGPVTPGQAGARSRRQLEHDAEALEVSALAEAHGTETGGPLRPSSIVCFGRDPIARAAARRDCGGRGARGARRRRPRAAASSAIASSPG